MHVVAVASTVDPGGHGTQASIADGLYWPAAHWVQDVEASPFKPLAIEPFAHLKHETVELGEKKPEAHAVHVVAPLLTTPVPAPISVIDPALQAAHAAVDEAEYVPEPHAVHVLAPTAARLSVIVPGMHAAHPDVDCALY